MECISCPTFDMIPFFRNGGQMLRNIWPCGKTLIYRMSRILECSDKIFLPYYARHPNIVQLRGTASYGNIYATIFHDGGIHNFLKQ
jgi:hypothetical protein